MANEAKQLTLTADDLQKLIVAAVSAAKEPSELEKLELDEKRTQAEARRAQIEIDQKMREETALQQVAIMQNRRAAQKICTHKHKKGDSHCVFVSDEQGGYILCQKCQAIIRAGVEPEKNTVGAIYDTALFNQLFQDCSSEGLWS